MVYSGARFMGAPLLPNSARAAWAHNFTLFASTDQYFSMYGGLFYSIPTDKKIVHFTSLKLCRHNFNKAQN